MRPLALLPVLFISSLVSQAAEPETSEMQDRGRCVMLTRAVPLMEAAARAQDLTKEQAVILEHLLQEQRRNMQLFMGFSGLSGEELQAKLSEVLATTSQQVGVTFQQADAP